MGMTDYVIDHWQLDSVSSLCSSPRRSGSGAGSSSSLIARLVLRTWLGSRRSGTWFS